MERFRRNLASKRQNKGPEPEESASKACMFNALCNSASLEDF